MIFVHICFVLCHGASYWAQYGASYWAQYGASYWGLILGPHIGPNMGGRCWLVTASLHTSDDCPMGVMLVAVAGCVAGFN
jgi:hypothetical protein